MAPYMCLPARPTARTPTSAAARQIHDDERGDTQDPPEHSLTGHKQHEADETDNETDDACGAEQPSQDSSQHDSSCGQDRPGSHVAQAPNLSGRTDKKGFR